MDDMRTQALEAALRIMQPRAAVADVLAAARDIEAYLRGEPATGALPEAPSAPRPAA